jgi:hypothetical protein
VTISGSGVSTTGTLEAANITLTSGVMPGAPSFTVYQDGVNYVAKAANGTVYFKSTNITAVEESAVAAASSGIVFIKDQAHNYSVPIKQGVSVVDCVNGSEQTFCNVSDSTGSPYTISVDNSVAGTTYYMAQDSADRIINSWTSTNASVVINNAFDNSYGEVYVKEGYYSLDTKIVMGTKDRLVGESTGLSYTTLGSPTRGVIFKAQTVGMTMIEINMSYPTDGSYFNEISNVDLNGNACAATGIYLNGALYTTIKNFDISNFTDTGIKMNSNVQNALIQEGSINYCLGNGTFMGPASQGTEINHVWYGWNGADIYSNAAYTTIHRSAFTGSNIGIFLYYAGTVTITENEFELCGYGGSVATSAAIKMTGVRNCFIQGNDFYRTYGAHIWMYTGNYANTIIDNSFGNSGWNGTTSNNTFPSIYLVSNNDNNTIEGNFMQFSGSNSRSILIGAANTGNSISFGTSYDTTPLYNSGDGTIVSGAGFKAQITTITNTTANTFVFNCLLFSNATGIGDVLFDATTAAAIKGYSMTSTTTQATLTVYAEDGKSLPATMTLQSAEVTYYPNPA